MIEKSKVISYPTAVEYLENINKVREIDSFDWAIAKEKEKWQRIKFEIPELSDEEIKEWIDSTPYYGHCTTEYK